MGTFVQLCSLLCIYHQVRERFQKRRTNRANTFLGDHPTQLICIWIFICWVGGGDPCGAAELCISGPCNQKKRARTHVFLKYPCHVHEDWLDGKIGTKNWVRPPKKPVCFMPVSKFLKWGIPQNRNFQIEGSLKIEISKMRDPSKWKFPKRGKVYTSAVFCKKYQASINVFQY